MLTGDKDTIDLKDKKTLKTLILGPWVGSYDPFMVHLDTDLYARRNLMYHACILVSFRIKEQKSTKNHERP